MLNNYEMPNGKTTRKHWADGYQSALADMAEKYRETREFDSAIGALNAMLLWIEDNTKDNDVRQAVTADVRKSQ